MILPLESESIMPESEYIHSEKFSVRDYECDIQGVVNNANYQHYLEHARHEFLLLKDIGFMKLHNEGTDLIVTKVVINYRFPLKSRDKFVVRTKIRREGNVRLVFVQDIYRLPDEKIIVQAEVTGVATKKGKPVPPGDLLVQLGI